MLYFDRNPVTSTANFQYCISNSGCLENVFDVVELSLAFMIAFSKIESVLLKSTIKCISAAFY